MIMINKEKWNERRMYDDINKKIEVNDKKMETDMI